MPTAASVAVLPTISQAVEPSTEPPPTATAVATVAAVPTATSEPTPTAEPTSIPIPTPFGADVIIGYSSQNIPIVFYEFGTGDTQIVFVGGMHGGYEWNTIVLAYTAIDYFQANPEAIPEGVTLTIIPVANPDGQYAVAFKTGRLAAADIPSGIDTTFGRFNGRGVDLNRNWDCEWQPAARWQDQIVSAGDAPFSEPESVALRDFLLERRPAAVVFWHSSAEAVFASGCGEIYQPSLALAQLYSAASRYPVKEGFALYEITGDAGDWLATQGIPAITVELRTHEDVEWERNLAGMTAVLAQYR